MLNFLTFGNADIPGLYKVLDLEEEKERAEQTEAKTKREKE